MPNTRTSIAPFLTVLREAVSRLPDTVPSASINDPIYQYFRNRSPPNETAFQTFERAFLQCFQSDPNAPLHTENVMRGEYGMDLIISYLEEFAKYPNMSSEELKTVALKLQKLVDMVHERIKAAPKPPQRSLGGKGVRRGGKTSGSGTKRVAKKNVPKSHHTDPYDADYTPGVGIESSGEELDMEAEKEFGILGFGKTASQIFGHHEESTEGRKQDLESESDDMAESSAAEETTIRRVGPRPGRSPRKGNWAMSNFEKIPTAEERNKDTPVWSFRCIWCGAFRTIARTKDCTDWNQESPEMKIFQRSNFISHLEKQCDKIPQDRQFSGAISHPTTGDESRNSKALALSQHEFNSALAKAVVHDNHAMTFGEGDGMIQFFQLLLPNIRLPSHQTLQRHLYRLFDALGYKIKDNLKPIHRHAIATDAWTSKSSVYSLAGVVLFFIDRDWRLHELVLDIINLDAEHSGAHMGKLVYRSLKSKETAGQAIACVTDNASANAVMNTTLAKRIQEREDTHIHGKGMLFTCVNHAFHLVCTDILSQLGVIEPGDHYTEVKGDDINSESSSEDEGNLFDREIDMDSDSDIEDLLVELGVELETEDGDPSGNGKPTSGTGRGRGRSLKPKALNATEKIHEIMGYVTATPKRRKEMRRIIAQTCPSDKKHLFVKKSMRIRWGSVRAEVKRAVELRLAITHFVATLDSSKSRGKLRDRARKLQERWTLKSEEWDLLTMLIEVLDPFQTATDAMSRRDAPTLTEVIPTFALLERKLRL